MKFKLVELWAHEHSYERLWPIYDYKVLKGSTNDPYRNPKAPVHIGDSFDYLVNNLLSFQNNLI